LYPVVVSYIFLGTLYLLVFVAFLVQKKLLLVLVLEGTERSSIFQECSEGIDPRSSPCDMETDPCTFLEDLGRRDAI